MRPISSHTASRRILRAVRAHLILLTFAYLTVALPAWAAELDDSVVWSIGKTDNSAIEFAPGSQLELTYKIGKKMSARTSRDTKTARSRGCQNYRKRCRTPSSST